MHVFLFSLSSVEANAAMKFPDGMLPGTLPFAIYLPAISARSARVACLFSAHPYPSSTALSTTP